MFTICAVYSPPKTVIMFTYVRMGFNLIVIEIQYTDGGKANLQEINPKRQARWRVFVLQSHSGRVMTLWSQFGAVGLAILMADGREQLEVAHICL